MREVWLTRLFIALQGVYRRTEACSTRVRIAALRKWLKAHDFLQLESRHKCLLYSDDEEELPIATVILAAAFCRQASCHRPSAAEQGAVAQKPGPRLYGSLAV